MTRGIDALASPLNSTYKQLIYEKEPQPNTEEETRNRQGKILLQGQSFLLIFPPLLSYRRIWKVEETLGEEPIKGGKARTWLRRQNIQKIKKRKIRVLLNLEEWKQCWKVITRMNMHKIVMQLFCLISLGLPMTEIDLFGIMLYLIQRI